MGSQLTELKTQITQIWIKRRKPYFEPKKDSSTGISFIDILFALVIGKVLEGVTVVSLHPIPSPRHAAMLVAAFITVSSWIGYNNSQNKPKYRIKFVNLPAIQFLLDIILVFFYWLLVVTSQKFNAPARYPVLAQYVTAIFGLYVVWDTVSWRLKQYEYFQMGYTKYNLERNLITIIAAMLAAIVWVFSAMCDLTNAKEYILDLLLLCISFWFRWAKDRDLELHGA